MGNAIDRFCINYPAPIPFLSIVTDGNSSLLASLIHTCANPPLDICFEGKHETRVDTKKTTTEALHDRVQCVRCHPRLEFADIYHIGYVGTVLNYELNRTLKQFVGIASPLLLSRSLPLHLFRGHKQICDAASVRALNLNDALRLLASRNLWSVGNITVV